ncbi:ribulokinase AraB [Thermoclostridium stercorarium subsp. stercorarium DSM 8532]|uniref:Ribulokinase n=3 Tax=Thermoclostridium stercorarium TaxID=1510 RepID=L7VST1_THES1|nr:ribulokinase [Thermoclostridium stercorarium]AGC68603.1 ribulokinase AraB [Thermoclostridium stercorarium subsp. stercorarium DSM 8532]AGI39614.1 AraB [Thermoclostridium stercorarium subsp. stercorarium DSM 8532]ANW98947.1 ribulokinase [Thermoclostridium stercorarium subsp. thermolacticum DSM 2910]ANX01476.1 ribulokinase [Thermoclostridium stercorarium subsp. leptospartum DSM 9219]UZQ84583.1 ribulokinase [Thermoclostridium stercorarium]
MAKKYAIGVDFGTLSGRAVLVEVDTGNEIATAVKEYPHGVMDEYLPYGNVRLEPDWALQHPQDYLDVLAETIPAVLKESGVSPDDVIGIGIDFTACTMLPIDKEGNPLCFDEKYKTQPHAYVKLWKHHAAQDEANRLNQIAQERGEKFLQLYGGKISSEWLIPKIWQILNEAPEIYEAADRFIEATDWIVLQLTGVEKRNSCTAGYKAIWHKKMGYPSKEFFKALDPRLENLVDEKLSRDIYPIGTKAGEITEKAAKLTGLRPGTAVAVGNVDAHVAVPAVGITEPGKMLMIIGTSTCHMLLGTEEKMVPGICGVVEDGIIPGYLGYEAGQSCVGDHFQWFIENCVPEEYKKEARDRGVSIHKVLREKASRLKPGESGLLALDWWNGNRSVLVDVDLTGMLLGCTLLTKPEEIYRALIEATAYGTRMIIDNFEEHGVPIYELYAAGGIAQKDEMMMQIYADVTNREIRISASPQTPALGSAMFGAVAAGSARGGFDSIVDAAKVMAKVLDKVYKPIPENVAVYEKLYQEYKILHDYFGRGQNDVMKRLKEIKKSVSKS